MTGFTTKVPATYDSPYRNMLQDISEEIKQYTKHRGIGPNYIIIHTEDKTKLLDEMISAKLILEGKPVGKLQYQGIRIIETPDLIKGFFEVLGN